MYETLHTKIAGNILFIFSIISCMCEAVKTIDVILRSTTLPCRKIGTKCLCISFVADFGKSNT